MNERGKQTRGRIIKAAREILNGPDELSLRAVATAAHMSTPALYRYVANLDELRIILAIECLHEGIDLMEERLQPWANDPLGASAVGAITFRHWALTHPQEFHLILTPLSLFEKSVSADLISQREQAEARLVGFYALIVTEIIRKYSVPVPALIDMDPMVVRAVSTDSGPLLPGIPTDIPLQNQWIIRRAWDTVWGAIVTEAIKPPPQGRVEWAVGLLAALRDVGNSMALGAHVDRVTRAAYAQAFRLAGKEPPAEYATADVVPSIQTI